MAYPDQNFEDELRDKLGNDAPLPPGMDWEAMRKGVHQKVGKKRETKKPFFAWWWPGIGVALLLLAGIIGYQLQLARLPLWEAPLAVEAVPTDQPTNQSISQVDATDVSVEDDNSDQVIPTPASSLERQANIHSAAVGTQAKADEPAQPSLQSGAKKSAKAGSYLGPVVQRAIAANSPIPTDKIPVSTVIRPKKKALTMLPFPKHLLVTEGNLLPRFPVNMSDNNQENNEADSPSKSKGWFIDILAGTQFAGATYQGDDAANAALRSETESALLGHHLAVGIGKNIGEKWQFRTGIGYDRIRTLTDNDALRTYDSTFFNVPLRVINGDTIYGVAVRQVRESRKLKSYQREQRLTIPLLIGRNFRLGRTSLVMRAGPEFGLLIGSGGKVFTADGSVRALSDADFQRLSISARLEGELAVPLGAKGPLLIGRIGLRKVLGGGPAEGRRTGGSVLGGVGLRVAIR